VGGGHVADQGPAIYAKVLGIAALVWLSGCDKKDVDASWRFKVDTVRNDMDNQVHYEPLLETSGKEGREGTVRETEVSFRISCSPQGLAAMLLTDKQFRHGAMDVRLKLDTLRPYTESGFGQSGMLLIGPTGYYNVLDSLRTHKRLLIEYEGGGLPKIIAEFSVDGIDSFYPRFRAACDGP
jgi:hypothetical protein